MYSDSKDTGHLLKCTASVSCNYIKNEGTLIKFCKLHLGSCHKILSSFDRLSILNNTQSQLGTHYIKLLNERCTQIHKKTNKKF